MAKSFSAFIGVARNEAPLVEQLLKKLKDWLSPEAPGSAFSELKIES